MSRVALGTAALLASTSLANAGGLDRTGQPVSVLFQDGNYLELSYGFTAPDVQGTFLGVVGSGDVGGDYEQVALSFKYDLSDRLSVGLILDAPFGADVDYGDAEPGYPIAGSRAEFSTSSITALARYKLNDNFSVHGGVRSVSVDADLFIQYVAPGTPAAVPPYTYDADYERERDLAYVVGAAYERPDIALRVALTYSSETTFENGTSYSVTGPLGAFSGEGQVDEFTLPQSVNLDFQTGIAPRTLLFGSIRWADWSETVISVPDYALNPVVNYEDDIITYTLGVGRQVSDRLAASAAVIYEPSTASDFDPAVTGSGVSNLAPTSGQLGLQLAASYRVTDSIEVGGGIRYTRLGDANTRGFGAEFEDNDAVSVGVRVGFHF
ncbi:OmpP1/FadL family transporter [Rubellimicrobium arenae]|uniref:OmpP1/FadL family transporter n=1 Tax=Rubellimicrobium arenae TaxID=2817372 RepID=UPI001B3161A4|nr:outer membrane protein transport protein [Rubellimicrobium arenae]